MALPALIVGWGVLAVMPSIPASFHPWKTAIFSAVAIG